MKRFAGTLLCTWLMVGCEADGNRVSGETAAPVPVLQSIVDDDQYFMFAIDGEPKTIPIQDVSTAFGFGDVFKIYAGADRQMSVILTVPDTVHCPCVVPAGSVSPSSEIAQGSVSLQHYPNPGNGLNSWYVGQPGMPADNAIEITDIGKIVEGARYVTGSFHTTVLKTESNGAGPENRDYAITGGKFRLRFETTGVNGF